MKIINPAIGLVVRAFAAVTCLGGCASMPDVDIGYFPATSSMSVTVTQTAMCTAANEPILTNDVSQPTIVYKSDTSKRRSLPIGKLGSTFGKQDATVEFHADGRLKSVNSKGTGQAAEALKAIIKLAPAIGLVSHTPALGKDACDTIRKISGNDKPLTIVHRGETSFGNPSLDAIAFHQNSVDDTSFAKLQPVFGEVNGLYSITSRVPPHRANIRAGEEKLVLVEPAVGAVTISVARGLLNLDTSFDVLVPQHGTDYAIPVQKAPWFGANEFEVVLHDSGKVTKLRYAGGGDVSGALGVVSDALALGEDPAAPSIADQAKAVQAQADLIYQQQRLVQCQADATKCAK